jgi:uncharacterized Zn-binding protein involved in type VI secretion
MGWPVVRLGDTSSHGGAMITAGTKFLDAGQQVTRVGDILACPIHGDNPVVTGSPNFMSQGQLVARGDGVHGSVTACGAILIGGSTKLVCD